MADRMAGTAALYTPKLLGLATELSEYRLAGAWHYEGEARSPTCGSTVQLGCDRGTDGRIARVGMQVHACAIGQAAAAIFARHADGREEGEIAATLAQMGTWLAGASHRPGWPELDLLEPARAYPARHGAIQLPWMAAARALSLPGWAS